MVGARTAQRDARPRQLRWLPLALALLVGCGGEPPFPAGEPCTSDVAVALTTTPDPRGLTAPHTGEQRQRWLAQEPGPWRSWALGRAALLECPPALDDAVALLQQAAEEAQDPCLAAGDRRVAHVLSRQPVAALALESCGGAPEHAWSAKALEDLLAGSAPDEAADPRHLLRKGPERILAWLRAPNAATEAELKALSRQGGGAELVEGWWEQPPTNRDATEALNSLVAYQPKLPDSPEHARRVASDLEALAHRMGPSAGGLPACRALHLAAWNLDTATHPDMALAWLESRPSCAISPWVQVTALERAAYHHRHLPPSAPSRDELLSQAVDEAVEGGLSGPAARLAVQLWAGRRRPALAAAERQALGALLWEGADLATDDRSRVLESYTAASFRSGERSLANVARLAFDRVAARHADPCDAPQIRRWAGFHEDGVDAQIRGLQRAEERIRRCPGSGPALIARLTLLDRLFGAGRIAEARALFPSPENWPYLLGHREELALSAARLDDPDAGAADLERFERLFAAEHKGGASRNHRGWMSTGYHSLIRQQEGSLRGGERALELMARREGLRWSGTPRELPPTRADLVGTSTAGWGGLAVATSHAALRKDQATDLGALLLDRATVDGFSRLSNPAGGRGGDDGLTAFADLVPEVVQCDSTRPLVGIGLGSHVLPPLGLLPAGDDLLGRCRTTAEWIPTAPEPSVEWTRGIACKAAGRATDPAIFGFESVVASASMTGRPGLDSAEGLRAATDVDVLHISAHGRTRADGHAVLQLGAGTADILEPEGLAALQLRPGALVTLAACSGAGGEGGDIPPDLPAAAIVAGAGAVLYSRYPVPSVELHEGLAKLYAQLPFDCRELADRWQRIRADGPRVLLAVEVLLSTRCLPAE
jgi:hypothetical protein